MDFFKYIHAVGTGVKGNRDLAQDEAKDMMEQVLKQSVYGEQIAAFLLGWRLKPETTEEFRGVVEACDMFVKKTAVPNSIELGGDRTSYRLEMAPERVGYVPLSQDCYS